MTATLTYILGALLPPCHIQKQGTAMTPLAFATYSLAMLVPGVSVFLAMALMS